MHHLRAIQALSRLRMPAWPFRGSIALAERDWEQTDCEVLVLNAWRHLGSARSPAELDALARARDELPPFDVDVFRLLQRALPRHRWPIVDLADAKASSRCLIRGQRNPDPPDGGVDESAFRT
jgi:hypothetical protein